MDIDFVLLWVNGEDPAWRKEKKKYADILLPPVDDDANADCRYRGNDELLRYWFRGVEENASWVRNIFFISCGQIPSWLETNHPALKIIDHKDFIPAEYLPTFNTRTIHFNLHRIKDLANHFVLFDDDVFLLDYVQPDIFFRNGYPVLHTYLGYLNKGIDNWNRVLWNNYGIVNSHFNIKNSIWKNRRKWFNIKELGFSYALYNYFCYRVNKTLPVFTYGHLAYPHLKSTINDFWQVFPDEAHRTCNRKFRDDDQLNQCLFLAWNQACGLFSPVSINYSPGKFFPIKPETIQEICLSIEKKKFPIVCLNDSKNNIDFEQTWVHIRSSFEDCFPKKSAFEK